jgi:mono/diheme cytochrome c family protein
MRAEHEEMTRMSDEPHHGRVLLRLAGLAAVACSLALAAAAQTPSNVMRGQGIAERACAGCHAMNGGSGTIIQGRDVPSFRAIAGLGWSAERLQAFITTPHRPMPATPLDASEVRDLADYILSLK